MAALGTVLSAAQVLFAALDSSLITGIFSTMGYKSDIQRLKTTVTRINNVLFDAGSKSVELNETAQAYIQDLKDAVYDADDLFDEFLTLAELKHQSRNGSLSQKVNNFCSSNNPLKVAYSMSRDVKKIRLKDLKVLSANLKNRLVIQFHVNFTRADRYEWGGSCLEGSEHLKEVEIHFSFPSPVLYLRRMDVERRVKEEVVMEKLQPHHNLKRFHLSYYAGDIITGWGRAEDNLAAFLPNLVYIKLSDCYRLQQLPLLSKLPHLKFLYLLELKNLKFVEEEEISGRGSGSLDTKFFPVLEFLEVRALKNLLGWSRTGNSSNMRRQPAFPRLSELIIQNCPLLLSFPHCLSLPKLDLRNNNEALRIVTSGEVPSQ